MAYQKGYVNGYGAGDPVQLDYLPKIRPPLIKNRLVGKHGDKHYRRSKKQL